MSSPSGERILTDAVVQLEFFEGSYDRSAGILDAYFDADLDFTDGTEVGTGQVSIPQNHELTDLVFSDEQVIPVVATVNGQRWSGRVATGEDTDDGADALSITLVDEWQWVASTLAYPLPEAPIALQLLEADYWVGPIDSGAAHYLLRNLRRLGVPAAVLDVPSPDTSPATDLYGRMTPLSDLLAGELTRLGRGITVSLWLPGDPQPRGQSLAEPTYVFEVVGNRPMPHLLWSDQLDGVKVAKRQVSKATAYRGIVGGTSPIPGPTSLLAFREFVDTETPASRYALPEVLLNGGAGAWTLDAEVAGRQGLAAARGARSASVELVDGQPHTFGRDYRVRDVVRVEKRGVITEGPITSVKVHHDNTTGLTVSPTVGTPVVDEDPFLSLLRRAQTWLSWLQAYNLTGG